MRMNIGLVVGILALVLDGPVAAQPTAPAAQPDAQQQRRDKIKQRVRAIRAYTLTEELSLDETTAGKLFPALAKYDEELDKLLAGRAMLQKRLEQAGGLKDAKAIDRVIDDAVANQKAIWDAEARRLEQLRKILTPAQVARTLVVLPAMERKIQSQLRKVTQAAAATAGATARSGELVRNPFDKRDAAPGPAKKKKGANGTEPCDPFSNVHGCK